jgi:hypothetical protein
MSSPGPPSIVSLVAQSKKAYTAGQALCARAHALSNGSAGAAFGLLALEAKVRWTSDAVAAQYKVCVSAGMGVVYAEGRCSWRVRWPSLSRKGERSSTPRSRSDITTYISSVN